MPYAVTKPRNVVNLIQVCQQMKNLTVFTADYGEQ